MRVLQDGNDPCLSETTRLLELLGADTATIGNEACADRWGWRDVRKRRVSEVEARQTRWDIVVTARARSPFRGRATAILPCTVPDPYRREAYLAAACGIAALSGDAGGPPLAPPFGLVTGIVGAHAAVAAVAALVKAERDAMPESVSISDLRATMSAVSPFLAATTYSALPFPRPGNRSLGLSPGSVLPCADGFIGIGAANDDDWALLARLSGRPELEDPRFATAALRSRYRDDIDRFLSPWLSGLTREELFEIGQAFRLPFAPARSLSETITDPHFVSRGAIVTADRRTGRGPRPAAPFRFTAAAAQRADRAGRRGRPNPADAPLAGFRVIDLSSLWSGPYACRLLAVLGADVVKVESPRRPDGTRGPTVPMADLLHHYADGAPGSHPRDRRAEFNDLNRGKRGVLIDLDSDAGHSQLLRILNDGDLVVDNYSPRVLPNFGLDPRTILDRYPGLSWISMPAFGLDGPYRDRVALGSGLELITGIATLAGATYGDGTPHVLGAPVTDCVAGTHAALAALALLRRRSREEAGGHLELAQAESALQLVGAALDVYPRTPPSLDLSEWHVKSTSDVAARAEATSLFIGVSQPSAGYRFHLRSPWLFRRAQLIESAPAPTFSRTAA